MKKLVALALIILLVDSCKKYPDGPAVSLRRKKIRVTGVWDVQKYTVDGIDSTGMIHALTCYGTYVLHINSQGDYDASIFSSTCSGGPYGTWEFEEKKSVLKISLGQRAGFTYTGAFGGTDVKWNILRLKNDEIWLQSTNLNKDFGMQLKKLGEK